ncbi:succinate dehydrogenase hydrophobic membrane anchor subunit [Subtercola boreus]|uniref:Succinate dehydrogenase n=1 Tax=Subtercola boreus TaxID=120213 RepID=A0A3E0WE06_9MICO|nr:succinate dehydrogenase hydrophobic membrane anchor subunit [Subtercola boreus]RFA22590.1 succinate dehydrogenase [Subtercola boreus]RFA22946.1 succinate dehydrogenase [Subtercola boreus]RFA28697.1 succinate dehydrogenase [Subtercola boreus]
MSAIIESPRQPQQRASKGRVNWEKYGWLYMRASGVLLIILIFGHLFVNLVQGEGIKAIDFAFVAGKYATPFWQIWDVVMLWLAMIHGSNGMRTIVNDYASNPLVRRILLGALFVAAVVLIVLGTLVVFTFDPCSTLIPADQALSFCPAP